MHCLLIRGWAVSSIVRMGCSGVSNAQHHCSKESHVRLVCVCRLLANGYNISTIAPNKGYSSLVKTAITGSADPMSGEHARKLLRAFAFRSQLMLRWPLSLFNLPQISLFPAVRRNRLR